MFKIEVEPTFPATLTLTGQGREQKLEVVFRHRPRSQYEQMLKEIGDEKLDVIVAVLDIVESWNADAPLDADTLKRLSDVQPGAEWAILSAYGSALAVSRKGN